MPIKDKSKYPPNWATEIRPAVLARDNNRCKFCGVENHSMRWNGKKYVKIVLTIAHLYDENPANCDMDNLAALCQKCHLTLDAKMHAQHAKQTREEKRNVGQLKLELI